MQIPRSDPSPITPDRIRLALSCALVLVGLVTPLLHAPAALVIAMILALAGAITAAVQVPPRLREVMPYGPFFVVAPSLVLMALFVATSRVHGDDAAAMARAAVLSGCGAALALFFAERTYRPVARETARLAAALEGEVRIIDDGDGDGDGKAERVVPAASVKAGDRVRVGAGQRVLVDAVIASGSAQVRPWLDARTTELRKTADAIVAGAEVVSGELVLVTTWAGDERGLARALRQRATRLDMGDGALQRARVWSAVAPIGVALLAGFAASLGNASTWSDGALAFGATFGALPSTLACAIVALAFARISQDALARGIFYRDARSFAATGRLERVAVCSGSALLSGTPEVVAVESVTATAPRTQNDVLALAAAAEAASGHAIAKAIVRSARERGLSTTSLRSVTHHAGLGMTAQVSSGERLVVGSRMLCMNESVSIALAEDRIASLEAKGRIVVLVALGERLLGWIALQDEMRPGARATVQRLVESGIEPVLLTGAARATAESLAASLAIEHVRPEVAPDERGAEVRALGTSATGVGALGHPLHDDGALGAATVAIALGCAGAPPGEWAVALATDRPEVGAMAVTIARGARDLVRTVIFVALVPGVTIALALGSGVLPTEFAWVGPIAGLLGAGLAWHRALSEPAAKASPVRNRESSLFES